MWLVAAPHTSHWFPHVCEENKHNYVLVDLAQVLKKKKKKSWRDNLPIPQQSVFFLQHCKGKLQMLQDFKKILLEKAVSMID